MVSGRSRLAAVVACGVVVAVVFGMQAAAAGALGFEFKRAFGPDGSSLTGFSAAASVAVDNQEEIVYVLDSEADALFKFDLEGNPVAFGGSSPNISGNELSGLEIGNELGQSQVAVNATTHTIYLTGRYDPSSEFSKALQAFQSDGEPANFTAGPWAGTNEIPGFGLRGVAVDANGAIYLAGVNANELGFIVEDISVVSAAGVPLVPNIPAISPANLTVDSNGTLYALVNLREVFRFMPSEYPVTESTTYAKAPERLDPNEVLSVAIDPVTNSLYTLEIPFEGSVRVPRVGVFNEAGEKEATFAGPGEAGELKQPGGIAVASIEEAGIEGGIARPFVTDNPEGGLSQTKIFQEEVFIGAPSIEASSALEVTADTARLRAKVNPNARPTTYHFEYGKEDCSLGTCTVVEPANPELGSGRKGVLGFVQLIGLQPGTTYHYRVVAENVKGVTKGPDKTFTTQVSSLGFQLADSRVWEMVSPPDKAGGSLSMPAYQAVVRAAADGEGLAYASIGSVAEGGEGNRLPEEAQVLARRGGGSWLSVDISPAHSEGTGISGSAQYQLFTPDLSQALLKATDQTPLSPQADERTPYLRDNITPPTFTPLLSNKEGAANVPSGEKFGNANIQLQGSNPELTDIVLSTATVPLIAEAPVHSLYLWHAGQLTAVSKKPSVEGGEWVAGALLGSGNGSVRHAISDDGSRVFWGAGDYISGGITLTALYLRDTESEETVRLDVPEAGAGGGEDLPAFQGANASGTIVYFTDSRQLTTDASPEGRDLYRCEIPPGAAATGCANLTDVSAPLAGSGESAQIGKRIIPAMSEDGSRVYFVAEAVLDAAPNSEGDEPAPEQPNLYLYEEGAGVRFIATLSPKDSVSDYSVSLTAGGSPSGRYLAFMSERSLTGYDNRDAASGEFNQEVFRYDAARDELECVSCNPSGGSPAGRRVKALTVGNQMVDRRGLWTNRWAAAILPETGGQAGGGSGNDIMLTQPRFMLDNGRVFFNAIDALVPADSNGNWDVYEYEPLGIGSCSTSSNGSAIARSAGGCVSLVSSGTAEEEAAFLDASESGNDAFFLTTAKLVEIDKDTVYDAYDARVNGASQEVPQTTECQGEACQSTSLPPEESVPASAAFQGAGNITTGVKHCRKGKRRVTRGGHSRCVARKHKKKHRAHHRTGKTRGAGR